MTAPARIRWEPTPYGTVAGYAGSLGPQVFHLWQSPCDHGDVALGEWELSAQFPASRDERWRAHGPDPGKLKAEAEEWLEEFVGSLGAVFPADLRTEIKAERDAQDQLAADHAESGHDWQTERAYGRVEALDWMLAALDRIAPEGAREEAAKAAGTETTDA